MNQVCFLSSTDENTLTASRLSTQRAPGDFDPSALTLGEYKVAPGVRVYEQFRDGAQVAVPLSNLDYGLIAQNQITAAHRNSSDIVDVIILNNVTGDAYTYGWMSGHTTVTERARRRRDRGEKL